MNSSDLLKLRAGGAYSQCNTQNSCSPCNTNTNTYMDFQHDHHFFFHDDSKKNSYNLVPF